MEGNPRTSDCDESLCRVDQKQSSVILCKKEFENWKQDRLPKS